MAVNKTKNKFTILLQVSILFSALVIEFLRQSPLMTQWDAPYGISFILIYSIGILICNFFLFSHLLKNKEKFGFEFIKKDNNTVNYSVMNSARLMSLHYTSWFILYFIVIDALLGLLALIAMFCGVEQTAFLVTIPFTPVTIGLSKLVAIEAAILLLQKRIKNQPIRNTYLLKWHP